MDTRPEDGINEDPSQPTATVTGDNDNGCKETARDTMDTREPDILEGGINNISQMPMDT